MLQCKTGDILTEDAEALVNTVNCVGVMGRGIALQFKRAFPDNFKAYAAACAKGEVRPGQMFVFERKTLTNPRYIINFPTKRHWRQQSRLEDIDAGLSNLREIIIQLGVKSVALPPLGCGLGGLHWPTVKDRIAQTFVGMPDIQATVFEPEVREDRKMARALTEPEITVARASLVLLCASYLRGLMDPFVSLLEIHKLMYFLQESGEPLNLCYVKHYYGPYAKNLRHVLQNIDGWLLSGYGDGGEDPQKPLELVSGAHDRSERFLEAYPETRARLSRVANLVEGYEMPFTMELLATVHWVATRGEARTVSAAVDAVHTWNERKRKIFSARQIGIAFETLQKKGWI
jgi:O-acetyl-ADP-ribose deacetylase (regulator of RNase III)